MKTNNYQQVADEISKQNLEAGFTPQDTGEEALEEPKNQKIEIGDNFAFVLFGILGVVALLIAKSCMETEIKAKEETKQKAIEQGLVESSEWGQQKWVAPESNKGN